MEKANPVTIRAFIDSTGTVLGIGENGVFDPSETYNDTIDRVYTGFLKLVKESRILQGTGPEVKAGEDNLEHLSSNANSTKSPRAGVVNGDRPSDDNCQSQ